MTDFASLGIRVQTAEVKEASTDLQRLAGAAERTEASVATMQPSIQRASRDLHSMGESSRQLAPALDGGARSMRATELSAKQLGQAMRLLPAQITDIVTGLVSGQPAYLVAIQQGGQLRDMFGSVGGALRAVRSILTPTRIAFGGLAAAATITVKGFIDGQREALELTKALTLSGNAAGRTRDEIYSMARAIDAVEGSQRDAVRALSQLASSGRVAGDDLEEFARIAVTLERTAGTPIEETVKALVELGRSPVQAALKLNEQMNFLTAGVYKQISALSRQGRELEAVEVAQRAYMDSLDDRSEEIETHLGLLQRLGRRTVDVFREVGDALLNIGRPTGLDEELANVERQIRALQAGIAQLDDDDGFGGIVGGSERAIVLLQQQRDRLRDLIKEQQESARAQARQQEALDRYVATEQRALAVGEARREHLELINKAQFESSLGGIQRQLEAALSGQQLAFAQLDALREADLIKDREYYNLKRQFVEDGTALRVQALKDERAQIAAEIQRLEAERIAAGKRVDVTVGPGGSRRSAPANREAEVLKAEAPIQREIIGLRERLLELEDQITGAKREGAVETAKLNIAEESGAKAAEKALTKARDAAQQYVDTLSQANDRRLASAGLGERQREILESRNRIDDDFAKQIADLDPTQEYYAERVQALQEANRDALAENDHFFDELAKQQSSFATGAREAFANYLDSSRNVAEQSEQLFSNAFEGMTNALADFATTGKVDFGSLAQSIIADLLKIQLRAAMAGLLGNAGGVLGGIFGGGAAGGTGAGGGNGIMPGEHDWLYGGPPIYADVGVRRVPRDNQVAVLHKDEAVIPARMNPFAGGRGFGGPNISVTQYLNPAPGNDVAQIRALMQQAKREAVSEVLENFSKGRWSGVAA